MRIKLIVNPTSGRGAGGRSIPLIEQEFRRHALAYELTLTERPLHAIELTRQAAEQGFEAVVIAAGDGTANEVLNGLMLAKEAGLVPPALAVITVGRGNDFAYGAGAPHGIESGVLALAEGKRHTIDVGRAVGGLFPQGRYFGNGVGIGFDAVVGFVAAKMKHLSGFPSYIVAALKTIFLYYHAPLVRVDYDGQNMQLAALMVSVMNGRRMGGGFMMAPNGSPEDGSFDLCIAEQVSRARIFAIIPKFMKGTQASDPAIRTAQARRVVVTALQGTLPAHADGETLCTEGDRLEIELLPRQLEVFVDETQKAAG